MFLAVGCNSSKNLHFELRPLSPFEKLNSFDKVVQKYKYFLLLGRSGEDVPVELVEKQVLSRLDSNYASYDNYIVVVYKKPRKMNEAYVENPSDIIEWHSDDILFTFSWERGKYVGAGEFKDGDVKNLDIEVKSLDSLPKKINKLEK